MARVNNKAGGSTREGSVTVIDPKTGRKIKELLVGLHPNEITSDREGRYVYLTNSNSDNVTVINTLIDEITETISVRLQPEINPFFGDSPNGLCLSNDEKISLCRKWNGQCIGCHKTCQKEQPEGEQEIQALLAVLFRLALTLREYARHPPGKLYVANLEASGARLALTYSTSKNLIYNSHNMLASVSAIPFPDARTLKAYTDTVIALNDLSRATLAREAPRAGVKPKPVPDRIGEPSVFKHVLYIIKENRTYDQILGDMKQGRRRSCHLYLWRRYNAKYT